MLHDIMGLDRALPWLALAFATGFAAGSIPFGLLLSRAFGLGDLRRIGSGNIGATNVLRTGNKLAAAGTLLLDAAKGGIPAFLFLAWGDLAAQSAAIGAMLGHCYTPWLKFKGGKGVATFLGVLFGLHWPTGILACLVWLAAAGISRISSVGALAAAAAAPVLLMVQGRPEAVLAVAALAALVWARHGANIGRLLRGEEPRIGGRRD